MSPVISNILTWVSAIGSVASIIGIFITFNQVKTVKSIALKTQREFNKTDAISDISKCNAIVKDTISLLNRNDLESTLKNMREIKDMIIKLKIISEQFEFGDIAESLKSQMTNHIGSLHSNINLIDNNHTSPQLLNKPIISKSLDELSSFIVEIQARITNRIAN